MEISFVKISDYLLFRDVFVLECHPGVNIIIGGNGAGKTTLLKAMHETIKSGNKTDFSGESDAPMYVTGISGHAASVGLKTIFRRKCWRKNLVFQGNRFPNGNLIKPCRKSCLGTTIKIAPTNRFVRPTSKISLYTRRFAGLRRRGRALPRATRPRPLCTRQTRRHSICPQSSRSPSSPRP